MKLPVLAIKVTEMYRDGLVGSVNAGKRMSIHPPKSLSDYMNVIVKITVTEAKLFFALRHDDNTVREYLMTTRQQILSEM